MLIYFRNVLHPRKNCSVDDCAVFCIVMAFPFSMELALFQQWSFKILMGFEVPKEKSEIVCSITK